MFNIDTKSLPYKVVRGTLGIAGSIGAALMVGQVLRNATPADLKKYQKAAVKIASVGIVWAGASYGSKIVKSEFDGLTQAFNELARTPDIIKAQVAANAAAHATRGE